MKKILPLLLITILTFPSALAYIDPGTGGYLISVLWQYIVAGLAFTTASILYFFKHKVLTLWQKKWVRVLAIILAILIVAVILYFIFKPSPTGGLI